MEFWDFLSKILDVYNLRRAIIEWYPIETNISPNKESNEDTSSW